MPTICSIRGIQIFINWREHLPPHFHAKYNDKEALIDINNSCVLKGALPSNKLKLVLAWSELHKDELNANWEKAKNLEQPLQISPLK